MGGVEVRGQGWEMQVVEVHWRAGPIVTMMLVEMLDGTSVI